MADKFIKADNHILWIDIAKGLGCILVILGHFWYNAPHPKVNTLIYSFHIPLFFVCAGFVFKIKKSQFIENVLNKFKRLMIPSLFFIILGVVMCMILNMITNYKELLKQIIYWNGELPFNAPVWFFIVLFEVYFIIYLLMKEKLNNIIILVITVVSYILGYIVYKYNIFIPFGLNRALLCLGFFTTGILMRRVCDSNKNNKFLLVILLIVSAISWFIIALINGKVSIYGYIFNNYWLLVLSGILGSIAFLIVSYFISYIKLTKAFVKISSISIFLIGTHYILVYYLEELVRPIWYTHKYIIYIVIMTVLMILIYMPICKVLDKYLPFITGKIKKD